MVTVETASDSTTRATPTPTNVSIATSSAPTPVPFNIPLLVPAPDPPAPDPPTPPIIDPIVDERRGPYDGLTDEELVSVFEREGIEVTHVPVRGEAGVFVEGKNSNLFI
jgi:hypothetical protein